MASTNNARFASKLPIKDRNIYVEYMPLSSLKPAVRNPKRHELDTVFASMRRFGYVNPLILDERTKRLVAGDGRRKSLLEAKAAGREPPPGVRVESGDWFVPVLRGVWFEDDREAEAYLLADNQTTILGGWDDSELKEILESLAAKDALIGTGFEDFFRDQNLTQDDPSALIDHA